MKESIIKIKSKAFALRIIKLYQYLNETALRKEYVLSKQVLRSGTSIGANVKEGLRGQSRPDFKSKMAIALKEACETEYWLELLHETGYIDNESFNSIIEDNRELIRILTSIVKNTKV